VLTQNMPRVTRAALRQLEDDADSANITLPGTPHRAERPTPPRTPLGEIAVNQLGDGRITFTLSKAKLEEIVGRGSTKKGARKARKKQDGREIAVEVLEDDNVSTSSSAAEEASAELRRPISSGERDFIHIQTHIQCVQR